MKSLNTGAIGVLGAALFAMSATVHAVSLNPLGTTPRVSTQTFTAPGPSFSDHYDFTLAVDSLVSGSATNLKLALAGSSYLDLSGFDLKLFDSLGNLLTTATLVDGSYQITDYALDAADYYFEVSGAPSGLSGGSYSFSAVATPVPEPTSLTLLALGLAAVGVMRLRQMES
jgi:hypothetical protein